MLNPRISFRVVVRVRTESRVAPTSVVRGGGPTLDTSLSAHLAVSGPQKVTCRPLLGASFWLECLTGPSRSHHRSVSQTQGSVCLCPHHCPEEEVPALSPLPSLQTPSPRSTRPPGLPPTLWRQCPCLECSRKVRWPQSPRALSL